MVQQRTSGLSTRRHSQIYKKRRGSAGIEVEQGHYKDITGAAATGGGGYRDPRSTYYYYTGSNIITSLEKIVDFKISKKSSISKFEKISKKS